MDGDTIFTALPDGEQIIDKYDYSGCCSNLRTVSILTNLRLLICRRYTTWGCCTRSSYTSIALDSIERVDEEPANTQFKFLLVMVLLLFTSIAMIIGGALQENAPEWWLIVPGIIGIVISIVTFSGTFGREAIKLSKSRARQLEGQLIEMCYKAQLLYFTQGITKYGQPIKQQSQLQPLPGVRLNRPISQSVESTTEKVVKRKAVQKKDETNDANDFRI